VDLNPNLWREEQRQLFMPHYFNYDLFLNNSKLYMSDSMMNLQIYYFANDNLVRVCTYITYN